MKDIAIVGAGGLGREVLVLLHQINEVQPSWNILGFYDDNVALQGRPINGLPYLGPTSSLLRTARELHLAIAIGAPQVKAALLSRLQHNQMLKFPAIIHPFSVPQPYQQVTIGPGTIISRGCVLTTNITIGSHVFLNLCCTLGHDVSIEDYAAIMPGVNISGSVKLHQKVYIGTNATLIQGLTIGQNTVIGAGAVVIRDVAANCTAVGVPAKIIKQHEL